MILDCRRRWRGNGKWAMRMSRLDPALATRLAEALNAFYSAGDKSSLMDFAAAALVLAGGRLSEGFRLSAEDRA